MVFSVAAFAQSADSLAGSSGWVGAGLLGCVLAWLMFRHLPAKDAQIDGLLKRTDAQNERKDSLLKDIVANGNAMLEKITTNSNAMVTTILERKDAQVEKVLGQKAEAIKEMLAAHNSQVQQMHAENKSQLAEVIQHCRDESKASAEMWQNDLNRLGEAMEELTSAMRDGGRPVPPRRRKPPQDIPPQQLPNGGG